MNKNRSVEKRSRLVHIVLTILFRLWELVTDTIFWFMHRNDQTKTVLPAITDPLILESAVSLAEKIRTQKVTSEDVVNAFISRIHAVNPIINCMVDNRFEAALEEAKNADRLIQSGVKDLSTLERETPFLGVPFTAKDCFAVKGLHYTSGLVQRKNVISEIDADVVSLMKQAGAIMLGITNVAEMVMHWESNNHIYGRSKNPYDLNRTAGGSSGGEGGLLAAGGSPCGLGTDIGGSIRIPSAFCGIFGHKPTKGIVSNMEQYPIPGSIHDRNFLTSGPMSRYCVDLLPMYRILAAGNAYKLKLDTKVSVGKLRYFYLPSMGPIPLATRIHPDVKQAHKKVVRHIQNTYNVPVPKVQFPQFYYATEMFFAKLSTGVDSPSLAQEMAMRKGEKTLLFELLKSCFGRSEHTLAAILLGLWQRISFPHTHPTSIKRVAMCDELLHDLKELLGDDGVLLVPSHPTVAPYHNQPLTKPLNAAYTAIFNVLGLPVTQVPLGLDPCGVPLGIQVVANHYNDHLTLAIAADLERAFGGWVPPSSIDCFESF